MWSWISFNKFIPDYGLQLQIFFFIKCKQTNVVPNYQIKLIENNGSIKSIKVLSPSLQKKRKNKKKKKKKKKEEGKRGKQNKR